MIFSEKMYESLKKTVQVVLPALATMYIVVAELWNLPAAQPVSGTLTAIATFLGVILGVSSKQYKELKSMVIEKGSQGSLIVTEAGEGKLIASLELDAGPEDILKMDSVMFQVVKPTPQKTSVRKKK